MLLFRVSSESVCSTCIMLFCACRLTLFSNPFLCALPPLLFFAFLNFPSFGAFSGSAGLTGLQDICWLSESLCFSNRGRQIAPIIIKMINYGKELWRVPKECGRGSRNLFWISGFNLNLKTESANQREGQEQGKSWRNGPALERTLEMPCFFYRSWLMQKPST